MNNLLFSLVLASIAALSFASPFSDCGSKTGQVSAVDITDCSSGLDVCPLKRGTVANITIQFVAKADSNSLKLVVHGVIASVPIPFPVPESDACKLGVNCPVKNGQSCTFGEGLFVKNSYPRVPVTVRYELKDEKSNDMVCVEIPCKIQ